jgi:hypothetical protein
LNKFVTINNDLDAIYLPRKLKEINNWQRIFALQFYLKLFDTCGAVELGLAGVSGLDPPCIIYRINKTHTVRRTKLSPSSATVKRTLAGKQTRRILKGGSDITTLYLSVDGQK